MGVSSDSSSELSSDKAQGRLSSSGKEKLRKSVQTASSLDELSDIEAALNVGHIGSELAAKLGLTDADFVEGKKRKQDSKVKAKKSKKGDKAKSKKKDIKGKGKKDKKKASSKKKRKSSSSSSSSPAKKKKKRKPEKDVPEDPEEMASKSAWIAQRLDELRQIRPPLPAELCLIRAQKEWAEKKEKEEEAKAAEDTKKDWPPMVHEAMEQAAEEAKAAGKSENEIQEAVENAAKIALKVAKDNGLYKDPEDPDDPRKVPLYFQKRDGRRPVSTLAAGKQFLPLEWQ